MKNMLLSQVQPSDLRLLAPHFRRVQLSIGDVVARRGDPITMICFPEGSVLALLTGVGNDLSAAVGLIGYEGMIGIAALHGDEVWSHDIVVRAQPSEALCIAVESLREACQASRTLHDGLMQFAGNFFLQVARTSVTNMMAPLEQRLARWILLYHDRVDGDAFELTHKELGLMLGIRRASATDILHILEGHGMIRNHRACVEVRDRAMLEACAGEGYGDTERDYRRRIGRFGKGLTPA